MKKKTRSLLLALPTVLALLLFFIGPMVYILIRTLAQGGSGAFLKFFTDEFYLKILWTTLRVSLLSTVVSLLLGYPTAYYMELTFDPTLAAVSTFLILGSLGLIVLMEKFVGLDMFVK